MLATARTESAREMSASRGAAGLRGQPQRLDGERDRVAVLAAPLMAVGELAEADDDGGARVDGAHLAIISLRNSV